MDRGNVYGRYLTSELNATDTGAFRLTGRGYECYISIDQRFEF